VLRDLPRIDDPNVLVGTETADDAGVYRLTDDIALVQTLDFFPPIVDDAFLYGQIAAANSLSDVYAMGGTPKTALNLVGFPDDQLPLDILAEILRGGAVKCQEAGCAVIGGHTVRDAEIKFGLSVTGIIHPKRILTNAAARPGDKLVLTKPLGTGFITTAAKERDCPQETLDAAVASMAMLNKGGCEAMLAAGAHSATDITGFGLAGHAFEMASGSGNTIVLHLAALPLFPRVEELVKKKYFTRASKTNRSYVEAGLKVEGKPDAVRLEIFYDAQTSGGLLASVPADKADEMVRLAKEKGCPAARIIGEVVPKQAAAVVLKS
jgi:selenide,water dikinase